MLVPSKKLALDPHPIDRDDFHAIMAKADDQGKAMLLLTLNSFMYGAEVTSARWKDIDLDAGTLACDRGKTGVARVSVLWKRTIDELRDAF